eukprot:CAMPEP_0113240614 /NCGR_PEP_ID=MMETSP0008_2-20120614/6358_1 /TAXON_ID=97485 /ORGANISM="Prymnesium parvum" /LENGTH=645 /DNA_ID=CAMNT_0000087969 /DNA_START=63 /DNA_END=1996 /DNA_ORIENTATION=+ /assembly_acc=CAM_ASM_000153
MKAPHKTNETKARQPTRTTPDSSPRQLSLSMAELDKYIDDIMAKAKKAEAEFACYTQEQVDLIFQKIAHEADKQRVPMAKLAAEETGMGLMEDKIIKNACACELIYDAYKNMKTVGVIDRDPTKGIVEDRHAGGDGVLHHACDQPHRDGDRQDALPREDAQRRRVPPAPARDEGDGAGGAHPARRGRSGGRASELRAVHHAAAGREGAGAEGDDAPVDQHPPRDGRAGDGEGQLLHRPPRREEDVGRRVRHHLLRQRLPVRPRRDALHEVLRRARRYARVVQDAHRQRRRLHRARVREEHADVARLREEERLGDRRRGGVGTSQPGHRRAVGAEDRADDRRERAEDDGGAAAEETGVGEEFPMSHEKLSPVLALYKADDFASAKTLCRALIQYEGIGHTAGIYSRVPARIEEYAALIPAGRILVNVPTSLGAIGSAFNFNIAPSFTLATGTQAGSSLSTNVTPEHLLNIKLIATRQDHIEWFHNPPRIFFNRNCLDDGLQECGVIDAATGKRCNRALIVSDKVINQLGHVRRVQDNLEKQGFSVSVFDDVNPDPDMATVRRGVAACRAFKPDLMICIGGGSPMDAGKFIRASYEHPELQLEDAAARFVELRKRTCPFPRLGTLIKKLVCIPTTSGTASEVTPFSV